MKKLILVLAVVFTAAISYGQLDTLNTVGNGVFNNGGDSKKIAYEKVNDAIQYINTGSTSTVVEITTITTLTATEIVGTAAGDVGHADGAILVAAPGAGYTLEFVSAFLIYDFGVAAYTGGADDAVIQVGVTGTQVAVSSAITGASLLEAAADKMLRLGSTATELVHADNGAISLKGTALTDPGTAVGVLRAHVTYKLHTTGL